MTAPIGQFDALFDGYPRITIFDRCSDLFVRFAIKRQFATDQRE